jgi:hypothetical protein
MDDDAGHERETPGEGDPGASSPAAAAAAPVDASPAPDPTSADTDLPKAPLASTPTPVRRSRLSWLWWALPVVMVVEFYVYGHDGRLEICVGKEGDTDFSLVGQERTDANRWKFPRCETRENLGLRSQRDAKVTEGIEAACRGATIFRHQGEAKACVAGQQGWQHRVEGHWVPPWDRAYYEHLFWFLQ